MDAPVMEGLKVHYNFVRKHQALGGKTPADVALVEVEGKNEWKTIIQNASLYKENSI